MLLPTRAVQTKLSASLSPPSLKAYGIPGRARLFEVIQKVNEVNASRLRKAPGHRFTTECFDARGLSEDPNLKLSYIVAPPRMARYVEVSAQIYSIYLKYIAPEDIFAYSIDEVYVTDYLHTYGMTAHELCMTLIREVLYATGITATGGIGTSMYLAKVAMDIVAKHIPVYKDGVRIAELDEHSYRGKLWNHTPLTDFWRIGAGTARKLEKRYIFTMGQLAFASTYDQEWFYREFGTDAEILIDHAWGVEPTTMELVKSYKAESNSLSEGQVLSEPYPYENARIIVQEMTDSLMLQLTTKELVSDSFTLDIGYDRENCDKGNYMGDTKTDHYGRTVPKPAHGSTRLDSPTNIGSQLQKAIVGLFDMIVDRDLTVRRITITANRVVLDEGVVQVDMFTDTEKLEKEKICKMRLLASSRSTGRMPF